MTAKLDPEQQGLHPMPKIHGRSGFAAYSKDSCTRRTDCYRPVQIKRIIGLLLFLIRFLAIHHLNYYPTSVHRIRNAILAFAIALLLLLS